MGSYEGMPTRSVCQLEFRCPMSLPRALKESSGCISMTTTFAPSSAARRAVAVPAWPAPHTTMSASTVSAMSLSGMSGSSPSQPAPSTSPMVLPALPVGAALPAADAPPVAVPPSAVAPEASPCGLHPASMPAPAAPAASTPAPCRKLRRLSSMRPRLLVKAAFWASFKRGSFLSTFSPFLLSWLPRLGAVAGDGRLLGCQAVCRRGLVVRLLERPDYGATWAP